MIIGFTYDLRTEYLDQGFGEEETAEFDQQETIDHVVDALHSLGHQVDCIGSAPTLMKRLTAGDRWGLVFNLAEGLHGYGREAQVPAILDVYGIPYTFSEPLAATVSLHKEWCKTIIRGAGLPTAQSLEVECLADLKRMTMDFPVLVKPVAEGTGKGVTPRSVINNRRTLMEIVTEQLQHYRQPVLVEKFLPGREFTTGILGTGLNARVLGTLEIVLRSNAEPAVYSYLNKEECESRVEYRHVTAEDPCVAQAEAVALASWRVLRCRDGGRIDLRCDEAEHPMFLEANPLAGMHPTHSDLPMIATSVGMPYAELVGAIVESAAARSSGAAVPKT